MSLNCQDGEKFPKGINKCTNESQCNGKNAQIEKNNQPNKGVIKSHACKNAGVKHNAAAKSHEKNGSSYQIKVIVIGFGIEMKSLIF